MRISLYHFAAIAIILGAPSCASAQVSEQQALKHPGPSLQTSADGPPSAAAAPSVEPVHQAQSGAETNPIADPKAVVTIGKARFTVLTPQLIRMEWAADGKFEDHASFVFINRRLPVPKFESSTLTAENGHRVTIKTSALTLHYSPSGDGKFTPDNLSIALTVDGKQVTWRPGLSDPEICKAPLAHSMAHSAARPRSPSSMA